jgi:16S rRNA processing protein RimM
MRLVIARVGRAHGIRGEVTADVRTDSPDERFTPGAVLFVTAPPGRAGQSSGPAGLLPGQLTLTGVRDHNGTLLLSFSEVGDRTAAEGLRGALLEADVLEADLPGGSGEEDSWYDHQLIGLRAVAPSGAPLGAVHAVLHGAQDLLVIRRPRAADALVPFVRAIVPEVDVHQGLVVIDAPPGLLSDLPEESAPSASAPSASASSEPDTP